MKTAIIYKSVHHGNTKKIAEVIAEALEAKLFDVKDINKDSIREYDLIGFGSGIYYGKPHKELTKFVEELDDAGGKKAFVFLTTGSGNPNSWLKENLSSKGFDIIGEFHRKGFNTFFIFKLIGGLNKGKPEEQDLKDAENFAKSLKI